MLTCYAVKAIQTILLNFIGLKQNRCKGALVVSYILFQVKNDCSGFSISTQYLLNEQF